VSRALRRRELLLGAAALAGCGRPTDEGRRRLAAVEARLGGRVGVLASEPDSPRRLAHRADERFALCSTFKAALAAMALRRCDEGALSPDARVAYGAADLLAYAPVTRARLADGAMTVRELCAAAVEVSDNTAANLLLARLGGPPAFTAFLRAIGDPATRLDRDEPALNTNLPGDPRDTTTPAAMARTLATLLLSSRVLGAASRAQLAGWMVSSPTGRRRLRAGMPTAWRVGDKTGTGERGACNDVAVVWRAGRAPLVVACYVDAPGATDAAREAAHAEVGRVVAERFG
jgi:beta-lactamase class A